MHTLEQQMSTSHQTPFPISQDLYSRAQNIIPGATHLSGRPLLGPANSPLYFDGGDGGRIRDVDGHEYVDFVMAYGPYLLGYGHAAVDNAGMAQMRRGGLLSLNHPLHVEFIEALLTRFAGADMGVFFKTGSEATTAAVRIARRATGRRLIARCGYHGWHDWCLPGEDYVPYGLHTQIISYDANRPETLEALLSSQQERFAAVIFSPEMVYPPDRKKILALMEATYAWCGLYHG
jgi:glutamate-1-semialdehyde aminotransferase